MLNACSMGNGVYIINSAMIQGVVACFTYDKLRTRARETTARARDGVIRSARVSRDRLTWIQPT